MKPLTQALQLQVVQILKSPLKVEWAELKQMQTLPPQALEAFGVEALYFIFVIKSFKTKKG